MSIEKQNSIVGTPTEEGLMTWRTESDMSVLFVNGPDLPTTLRSLADEADRRDVTRYAIDLQFLMEDDDTFTIGLVLEEVSWL